ncbi:transposase (plasmid) [Pseudomonas syringae pv. cerasicola]|nr:transposase [Pseudomonas syringae pv. cerasicola]
MMKQMTFADAEYAGKRKQTRKELFLIEMDQVVPWKGLIALIEPYYPKGEGGRPAYPLMAMLRVHLMQNWFGYSDPAMEEALYETTILRQFSGLSLGAHSRRNHHSQLPSSAGKARVGDRDSRRN